MKKNETKTQSKTVDQKKESDFGYFDQLDEIKNNRLSKRKQSAIIWDDHEIKLLTQFLSAHIAGDYTLRDIVELHERQQIFGAKKVSTLRRKMTELKQKLLKDKILATHK